MIQMIDEIIKNGTAKKLIAAGFLSPKIISFRNIYFEYDKMKRTGRGAKAASETALKFNVSRRYVNIIVKHMRALG